ncbi:MAG: energy transducer TonB [Flavobacteriaceae bacterium]|nr:energy transducer TonB [Flavobacteriaceae bacterium]
MSFLDTPHKRKSAVLTTLVMGLLLLIIFTFGMTYLDPPEELGIAVNFGTTDFGSGNVQPTEPIKSNPVEEEIIEETQEEVVEETPVEEVQEAAAEPEAAAEKVVTAEEAESIRLKKAEEARHKAEADAKRKAEAEIQRKKAEAERVERERIAAEKRKRAEEAAKRKKLDAMMGGLNESDGTASGGEGNDSRAGDKGQLSGDPYGISYFGDGSGSGGYGLKGRNLTRKGTAYQQDCNEYGRVVVKIEVDKNGKVIRATPGVKGSTNTASCLLAPAKKSAMSYRWNTDSKAPSKQIGFVIVNFN